MNIELPIRLFREGAQMPTQGTKGAAGFDLYAWIPETDFVPQYSGVEETKRAVVLQPNEMLPIKTGINIKIPEGYEVQIRPRSGLAFKHQITVQNAPGTVDFGFWGVGESFEVVVLLRNEGLKSFVVRHGDRIAQMVVNELPSVTLVECDPEDEGHAGNDRTGGFGSTGVQ